MKNIFLKILVFFLTVLLLSCSEEKAEAPQEELKIVAIQLDTLAIGNKVYQVQDLQDTSFAFEKFEFNDPSDSAYIERNKNLINRQGDTLYLKCDNGVTVKLKNNRTDGDDMMFFDYKYFNKDINAYVVYCSYYESYAVWLINKHNTDTVITINYPVVSPDKKQFICANIDLEAGFTANGIQLFKYTDNNYGLFGFRDLDNWGPEKVMWKNDTTLIIKGQKGVGGESIVFYKALYIK